MLLSDGLPLWLLAGITAAVILAAYAFRFVQVRGEDGE